MNAPETLLEAVSYFSNPENAFQFFKAVRWPNGVRCPRCGSDKVTFLENAKVWKCRTPHPKQKFSAKVGTIFEDSPIGLEKWLPAMWLAANCKNGISSYELHRALGVTQKTAWFMLQRIRLAMQKGGGLFKGEIEVDETFIGGRARKMNTKQRARRKTQGSGQWNLEPVQGILERTTDGQPSQVRLFHVTRPNRKQLDPNVRKHVEKGADISRMRSNLTTNLATNISTKSLIMPSATRRGVFTRTAWKTFGACSSAALVEPTLALSSFICFAIWMNKRLGLMNAKTMTLADLLRRFAGWSERDCRMRSS